MDTKQNIIKNPKSKGGAKKLFSISSSVAPGMLLVKLLMLDVFMLSDRLTMGDIDHEGGYFGLWSR